MKPNQRLLFFTLFGLMLLAMASCNKRQHSCAAYDGLKQQELLQQELQQ